MAENSCKETARTKFEDEEDGKTLYEWILARWAVNTEAAYDKAVKLNADRHAFITNGMKSCLVDIAFFGLID